MHDAHPDPLNRATARFLNPAGRHRRRSRIRGVARRFGWGLADQTFSSLTNFALTFLVARSVSAADFGVFAIAFAVYLTALGIGRAALTTPLSIRFSARPAEWGEATRSAAGGALVLGAALGGICAVAGVALGGRFQAPLSTLGVCLPLLLLQDTWRFAFFAIGRGRAAFVNDVIWAVALLPLLVAISFADVAEVATFVAVWGGSAGAAAVAGAFQAHVAPRPALAVRWWREHRDLTDWFVGEFVAIRGSVQIATFLIAGIVGVEAVGAVRAGNVLMGPVNTVQMGLVLVAVPEGVRMLASAPGGLRRTMSFVSASLCLLALAWGGVLLLLPGSIGRELLGATWETARTIIVPLGITGALAGAAVGFTSGLRSLAAGRETLRARFVVTALGLGGVLGGALIGRSAAGVAWGDAVAAALSLLVWWRSFRAADAKRAAAAVETEMEEATWAR